MEFNQLRKAIAKLLIKEQTKWTDEEVARFIEDAKTSEGER